MKEMKEVKGLKPIIISLIVFSGIFFLNILVYLINSISYISLLDQLGDYISQLYIGFLFLFIFLPPLVFFIITFLFILHILRLIASINALKFKAWARKTLVIINILLLIFWIIFGIINVAVAYSLTYGGMPFAGTGDPEKALFLGISLSVLLIIRLVYYGITLRYLMKKDTKTLFK